MYLDTCPHLGQLSLFEKCLWNVCPSILYRFEIWSILHCLHFIMRAMTLYDTPYYFSLFNQKAFGNCLLRLVCGWSISLRHFKYIIMVPFGEKTYFTFRAMRRTYSLVVGLAPPKAAPALTNLFKITNIECLWNN